MHRSRRVVSDQRRAERLAGAAVAAAAVERRGDEAPADRASRRGTHDDRRKRHGEREDRDERSDRERHEQRMLQRARADSPRRDKHDRRHRGLDPVQHARDRRHMAEAQVDPRQRHEHDERRQHEQRARDDPAGGPVHQPADVRRELLRFGSRQHHAVVQRVQEALLLDPAAALDQIVMHDRDLPRRPTKADKAEPQPIQEGGAEGNGSRSFVHAVPLTRRPESPRRPLAGKRRGRRNDRGDAPACRQHAAAIARAGVQRIEDRARRARVCRRRARRRAAHRLQRTPHLHVHRVRPRRQREDQQAPSEHRADATCM